MTPRTPLRRCRGQAAAFILVFLPNCLVLSTAAETNSIESSLTYSLESVMDKLEAVWPAPDDVGDRLLPILDGLPGALRGVYQDALQTRHAFDPGDWEGEHTPQSLARRNARIISPDRQLAPWQPEEAPRLATPPGRMPRFPDYFGVQCLTPIPGRPASWSDFIVASRLHGRVHAARYDERNVLREFVLMAWRESGWRALACSWYPDGILEHVEGWVDGPKPVFRTEWNVDGALRVLVGAGPPPVMVTCTVSISLAPPEDTGAPDLAAQRLLPVPVAGLYRLPAGAPATIEAPALNDYEFAGWSGDASGTFRQRSLQPEQDLHLVAHYRWRRSTDGNGVWVDPVLRAQLTSVLGKEETEIGAADLATITALDLSATQFKEPKFLRHLFNLRELDLTGTPVSSVYPLSSHAAFEAGLEGPAWSGNTNLLNKVMLALHAGTAPPVETLKLNDNRLRRPDELAYLRELLSLELRRTGLASLTFVRGLQDLVLLDVSDNDLVDLAPIAAGTPRLQSLFAGNNKITDIAALAERAEWPGSGAIALEGNPLSPRALCQDIPALAARGLTITHSGQCAEAGPANDDTDSDGDGYAGWEEWEFVCLFTAGEAERNQKFIEAVANPEIPKAYLSLLPGAQADASGKVPITAVPTTPLVIEITGQGAVYPGPGTHAFAREKLNPDHTWEFLRVTLTPAPAPGWELTPLDDFYFQQGLLARTESGDELVVNLDTPWKIGFEFRPARVALDIDLVDALVQFVKTYYPDEDPYLFDMNGLSYHNNNVQEPAPNGIPDAAEFRLLQAILQTPEYNHRGHHGTSFDEAMEIWNTNLPIAQRALGETAEKEPFILHVFCAYVTAGGWSERRAAIEMLRELKGLEIERGQFKDGLWTTMHPDKNIHDGATYNEKLWMQVTAGRKIGRAVVDAYAELVLSQPPP